MDILADVLRQAGLKGRHMHHRTFSADTGMAFPCTKSIGFHVVTQGQAYIHVANGQAPLALNAGDLALMARGCNHIVSSEPALPERIWSQLDGYQVDITFASNAGKPRMAVVSGVYQFWNEPVHPFFGELPDWFVLRAGEVGNFDQMQLAINLLTEEVRAPNLGSETVTRALLDIIFMHIVRKILAQRQDTPATWSNALHTTQIKAAIELMHADCAHEWTLDELARQVGLSRAGFAQKFKTALGATPLQYLTTIRVQKAMDLLVTSADKIETIAVAVGYSDAFSFSKVFKKVAGVPPREFRLRDLEQKDDAFRIQ